MQEDERAPRPLAAIGGDDCREAELAEARHRAEALARDLQLCLDVVNLGVVILDRDLNITLVNRAFFDIWGVAPQDVSIGGPFRTLMDANRHRHFHDVGSAEWGEAEWADYAAQRLDEIRQGDVAPREFRRANGFTLIYSVTSLSHGRRLLSYYDITEMKRREEALEEAQHRAEALLRDLQLCLDVVNLGVIILDGDLNTTLVNKAFCDIWKVAPSEVPIGGPFRALMDANRRHGIYDLGDRQWEDYIAERLDEISQGDVAPREFRRADGVTMIYSVTSLSHGRRLVSYYDITEMKRREEALEEAQRHAVLADRAKSEFLANMSHEIRTPMNSVLGMAELLGKSDLDPRQKTFVDIIAKSGTALLTIINDILDFSKIDAGQMVLDPAPFCLAEAIEDVATLVSTRAKEKNLELVVRVQPGLHSHYVGDVGRIRQIVTNLVGNAVKFTESGHVLADVGGEDDGDDTVLRVAVTDTGIGIPHDRLSQVFDKFSQVDASSTRRHEGTGLGLAITSRLVAMMDGEIGVESREGEGSTFWFTIRLPRAETARKEPIMPVDVSGARILVVDDNAVNRAILMEQMADWGFDACAADSGEEGSPARPAAATSPSTAI